MRQPGEDSGIAYMVVIIMALASNTCIPRKVIFRDSAKY